MWGFCHVCDNTEIFYWGLSAWSVECPRFPLSTDMHPLGFAVLQKNHSILDEQRSAGYGVGGRNWREQGVLLISATQISANNVRCERLVHKGTLFTLVNSLQSNLSGIYFNLINYSAVISKVNIADKTPYTIHFY